MPLCTNKELIALVTNNNDTIDAIVLIAPTDNNNMDTDNKIITREK